MANTESSDPQKLKPTPQQLREFSDAVSAFLRTLNDCYWITGVQRPRFLPDVKRELVAALTRVEQSHNPDHRPLRNPDRGFWEIENWPEPERLHRIYRWICLSINRTIVDWGLHALCSGQPWELSGRSPLPWVKDEPDGVVIVRYDPAVGWPPTVDQDLVDAMAAALKQWNEYLGQHAPIMVRTITEEKRQPDPGSMLVTDPEKRIAFWGQTKLSINSHGDFSVLCALEAARGGLVSYAELLRVVKPKDLSAAVEEISECPQEVKDTIAHIRKALKEVHSKAKVETVKTKGFRLSLHAD